VALLIAGALVAVATFFHPNDAADPNAVTTNAWVIVHTLYVPAFILGLFGLIGLYARQAEQARVLGLIGFILAFIGVPYSWSWSSWRPLLYRPSPRIQPGRPCSTRRGHCSRES